MTAADYIVDPFTPAYLLPNVRQSLAHRADLATASLQHCCLCPRRCGVNRLAGQTGFCRTGALARVCSAMPHPGEERSLSGTRGSGTIFFNRCNLRCAFCQNHDISQADTGDQSTPQQIASLMLRLQALGCHNINLVTPSHVVPQIIQALPIAVGAGLNLPIVYNTNAYDLVDTLKTLDGLIDIYMPDFKFWSPQSSARYLAANDYPQVARHAISEMHRQVGPLSLAPNGLARRGLLVRHLVMPGFLAETAGILSFLAQHLSHDTYVNIMAQYHPDNRVGKHPQPPDADPFPEINRRPTPDEIAEACRLARHAGLWRFDDRSPTS